MHISAKGWIKRKAEGGITNKDDVSLAARRQQHSRGGLRQRCLSSVWVPEVLSTESWLQFSEISGGAEVAQEEWNKEVLFCSFPFKMHIPILGVQSTWGIMGHVTCGTDWQRSQCVPSRTWEETGRR